VVLVDTSAWIEHLRAGSRLRLTDVVDFEDVVTCLPVVQEVLQGVRDEGVFRRVRTAMVSLPTVESPLTAGLVQEAVALFRSTRRVGLTPRSSVDCLIAACALRHDLEVLHRDRDYDLIARVCPLRTRRLPD
jgi:predicted nucleic acid-binding protein